MLRYLYQFPILVPTLLLFCFSPCLLQAQGDPDCVNSIVLCSNADITFNPSGIGMINDFASPANNQGCLTSGERNTAWYFFAFNPNMPANSQIEFTITPSFPADYDFAVYGPDVNCNGLGSPVRCSYAAGNGPTGLGNGATDTSEGAGGNGWVAPLTVQPGQGFYLVIDNFSGNGAGFNMSWGGSAASYLDCSANPNCNIQANYAPTYTACQSGASFVFQGAVLGLTPGIPVDYVWDSPNGIGFLNNPFSANPTFFPPSDQFGTFTFTLTITQETCEQTATVSVTILPPPQRHHHRSGGRLHRWANHPFRYPWLQLLHLVNGSIRPQCRHQCPRHLFCHRHQLKWLPGHGDLLRRRHQPAHASNYWPDRCLS